MFSAKRGPETLVGTRLLVFHEREVPEQCTLGKLLLLRGVSPPSFEKAVAAVGVKPRSPERPIAAAFPTVTLYNKVQREIPVHETHS